MTVGTEMPKSRGDRGGAGIYNATRNKHKCWLMYRSISLAFGVLVCITLAVRSVSDVG